MSRLINAFRAWVPFAIVVTAFCALAYMTVQQDLRQGANDPQIQMAEDSAAALNNGTAPQSLTGKGQVELSSSLAPFLIVFDASGKPVTSSGMLHGQMPDYPIGALESARHSGENRVTWQPEPGVRVASVAVPYEEGYVVAGRSLREVEKREAQTEGIAATVWAITLVVLLVVAVFQRP